MMRRWLMVLALLLGVFGVVPAASVARACPMCRAANQTDSNRPRAYMYSILFMLAVPATLAACFGIGFYRLSKKQQTLNADAIAAGQDGAEVHPQV